MRRKKYETINYYGDVSGNPISSSTSFYYVNKPRIKHKKKPISMIKALDVRDRINNKINTNIDNKI